MDAAAPRLMRARRGKLRYGGRLSKLSTALSTNFVDNFPSRGYFLASGSFCCRGTNVRERIRTVLTSEASGETLTADSPEALRA